MVLASPEHSSSSGSGSGSVHGEESPKRLTFGLLMSISSVMHVWARRATQFSSKLKTKPTTPNSPKHTPRSPLGRPKQLLTQISNKAITLIHSNKKRAEEEHDELEEDFGDGGVWQRAILMGDKCKPLDFSGVIYYDSTGKQLNEVPLRSPRASPLPGYMTRIGGEINSTQVS